MRQGDDRWSTHTGFKRRRASKATLESIDALLDEVLVLEPDEKRRDRLKRALSGMVVTFGRRCRDEGWDETEDDYEGDT